MSPFASFVQTKALLTETFSSDFEGEWLNRFAVVVVEVGEDEEVRMRASWVIEGMFLRDFIPCPFETRLADGWRIDTTTENVMGREYLYSFSFQTDLGRGRSTEYSNQSPFSFLCSLQAQL